MKYTAYSCDVEDFVETHLCKLCVVPRSRVLLGMYSHQGYAVGRLIPLLIELQ